ncbi:MAG: RlmF-related methyltransferase, partial [Flavobacteriales bacterium]
MIRESLNFSDRVFWFSTLVSKQAHLDGMYRSLQKAKALEVKTIPLGTGNKSTRIVAWTFLDKEQQKEWQISRWKQG